MPKDKLTQKQKDFCREYVKDFNGAQAAIRAGYSKNGARVTASQLLTNPNIQQKIQELIDKRAKRQEIDADMVLKQLVEVVEIGTGKKTVSKIQYNDIKGEYEPRESSEINLPAVNKAVELLGKHLGMFTEKMDINAKVEHSNKLDDIVTQLKDK